MAAACSSRRRRRASRTCSASTSTPGGVTPVTRGDAGDRGVHGLARRGSAVVLLVVDADQHRRPRRRSTSQPGHADAAHACQRRALLGAEPHARPTSCGSTSFDGRRVQTWVQKPPDFDPSKKYPLILNIHGGPHAAYGYTFDHEFQWMAAKGYVVVYPNPRGSTSYGQEFGNIIQYRFPGDDAKDLMSGRRRGDQARVGRSEAALRHRRQRRRHPDELDRDADGSLCGGGLAALDRRLVGLLVHRRLHAVSAALVHALRRGRRRRSIASRSPITFVDRVKTPMKFIEGEQDLRTPAGRRRRADVPRAEVPKRADGDGAFPRREPRALTLGAAVAPRRAPSAHRRLVRQISTTRG